MPNKRTAAVVTPEALDELHRELGRLLWKVENLFGDNAAGTYPSEVEMTLRLAWTSAGRAAKQMREDALTGPVSDEVTR